MSLSPIVTVDGFRKIVLSPSGTIIEADQVGDTLTLVQGLNVTFSVDTNLDQVTINAGTAYGDVFITAENTNASRYMVFVQGTSGPQSTYIDTNLTYNPGTNTFTAGYFSGDGGSLTNITAGNLFGTIPGSVLGNSTVYIGTTSILLNRTSGSQTLTGVGIDGNAATATKSTNLIGGNSSTLLGSIPYQSNTDTTTLLGPNTTSTKKYLTMTGTGVNGAVPAWDTIAAGDVPTLNQNTTGTASGLSGNQNANYFYAGPTTGGAATATFRAIVAGDIPTLNQNTTGTASGLSGNQTANTVYAAPNGSSGTASFRSLVADDIPTVNIATNLAGGNNTTLLGSIPYQSNTNVTTLLAPNTTATKRFLRMTGTGTNGAVPTWDSVTASDVGLGNVTNESKATMFSSPTFTGTVSGITQSMITGNSGYTNVQVYTSGSGNWTIPAGVTRFKVTAVGGGGGGAAAFNSVGGGAGGAGGTAIKYYSGQTPGNTLAYSVGTAGSGGSFAAGAAQNGGAGSATTFNIMTANGGGAGLGAAAATAGAGGTATGGDLNFTGQDGQTGTFTGGSTDRGGATGGSSLLGTGGHGAMGGAATAGTGYGAGGGSGGATFSGDRAGKSGSAGVVIIEY